MNIIDEAGNAHDKIVLLKDWINELARAMKGDHTMWAENMLKKIVPAINEVNDFVKKENKRKHWVEDDDSNKSQEVNQDGS
jgi:hypothetical protein